MKYSPPYVPWDELYSAIGKITLAINHCNWLVFEAMRITLKMEREEATSIFYSLKSDSAQRELATSVLSDRLGDISEADLLKAFKDEVTILGKLSGVRNGFIHTPWAGTTDPDNLFCCAHGAKPHPKLDFKDPISQAKTLVTDLWDSARRLDELCARLEKLPSLNRSASPSQSGHEA